MLPQPRLQILRFCLGWVDVSFNLGNTTSSLYPKKVCKEPTGQGGSQCCHIRLSPLLWTSMVWFKGKLCFDQILDKTFTGGANQSSLPPSSLPTSGLHQHTDILLISRLETFLQEEKRRNKKINQNHLLYSYWTFKVNIWKGVPGVFVCGPLAFRPWDRLVYIRGRASTVRHATFRFSVTFFERKN